MRCCLRLPFCTALRSLQMFFSTSKLSNSVGCEQVWRSNAWMRIGLLWCSRGKIYPADVINCKVGKTNFSALRQGWCDLVQWLAHCASGCSPWCQDPRWRTLPPGRCYWWKPGVSHRCRKTGKGCSRDHWARGVVVGYSGKMNPLRSLVLSLRALHNGYCPSCSRNRRSTV